MMSDIYIRQLSQADWQAFRTMRLKALRNHQNVFLSRYADEAAKEDAFWQETLAGKDKAIFGLYDDEAIIGIGGVFTLGADTEGKTAILGMGYIDSAYRGRGLSRLLYEARINWAKNQAQFEKIIISHREGNEASRRANQAFGFVYTHTDVVDYADGKANDLKYEMRIKR